MTPAPLPLSMSACGSGLRPVVVLDTNVVFDWLLFRNPGCAPLAAVLETGGLQWIATAAMQDEFFHVLDRGRLDRWQPDRAALRTAWAAHHQPVADTTLMPSRQELRCSDTDDQKFIDLAASARGCWLVSRDRAIRRLGRPLRRWGVAVGTPEEWTLAWRNPQTTCCESSPVA